MMRADLKHRLARVKLSAAQIGRCGELLVQLKLLRLGIDSAALSTDKGVDLVAYSPSTSKAISIQVKTNLSAKPGGGKGKNALDWWVKCPMAAAYAALVELSSDNVRLLSRDELESHAQQRSGGRLHLYMYVDPTAKPRNHTRLVRAYEFGQYLLANCAHRVFGAEDACGTR